MKTTFKIFLLATALIIVQSCGTKPEKTNEASVAAEVAPKALTPAEKRAQIEKSTAERAERRRLQQEEVIRTSPTYMDKEGNLVYNKAEVDPTYTGGDEAMIFYLNENIKFPKDAERDQVEGTVFVDFVVTPSGNIREVMVNDDTNSEVDQRFRTEAIRVITSMPKWIPGRQHGKAVAVKYSLPIVFKLT